LFAEANENRNQFNDAAWLMLNPHTIVNRETAGLKVKDHQGEKWEHHLDRGCQCHCSLKNDWNLLNMCLFETEAIYEDIQNCTNASSTFVVLQSRVQRQRQSTLDEECGELRSDTYNLLLAMQGIETIVKDIVDYKKMFMIDQSSSYYWLKARRTPLRQRIYNGNFAYKSFHPSKHAKEIERKQFIEAMTLVWGNQAFMPFIVPKTEEWLERLLDYFDLRSPEQLRLTGDGEDAGTGDGTVAGDDAVACGGGTTAGGAPILLLVRTRCVLLRLHLTSFMAQMAGR